ncbi:MAG: dCMP deaminase [Melioribacteraceae bacterium]|nr:dCMP deaminase [Melioribacteraceae bacterium]MCF8355351.1 dCMP deaminase [Melioribacteraceae bacterium]MCF8396411.1 dCMP deaminase [Melioribacteraceae bacterium]MCF8417855.1 dCMP deaminase [Melioribacteraceae bacterium]
MKHSNRNKERPTWDTYFLKVAMLVSERATCPRMHCGCVLVRDKRILSTGYNGSIPGDEHCEDIGCMVHENHCIRTIHAEMNAIIQCAIHGVSTQDATAYVTNMPCTNCTKALIGAGIKEVVIFSDYHDTKAEEFFAKANVPIRRINMPEKVIDYDLESFTSAKVIEKEYD